MSRNTIQQDIIYNTVKSMPTHPSPDEVYQAVQTKYPSIGRATVYRVLNKLAEKGDIKKVIIPDTAGRFDFRTDDHIHLRCRKCNKVFDANFHGSKDLLTKLDDVIAADRSLGLSGFESDGVHLSFYGVCEECRKAE